MLNRQLTWALFIHYRRRHNPDAGSCAAISQALGADENLWDPHRCRVGFSGLIVTILYLAENKSRFGRCPQGLQALKRSSSEFPRKWDCPA
jgi:hypothetical protein